MRVDGERRNGGEEDRVAVGIRLGDHRGGDRSAGAGAVFDDDRLAEIFAELLLHDARHGVGPAPRREADHDGDRTAWIGLPSGVRNHGKRRDEPNDSSHFLLLFDLRRPFGRLAYFP